jgi:hypothetical protein
MAHQLRQILPAPEPLTRREELEPWLVLMRVKFAVDGATIGPIQSQFYYVYSSLR